MNKVDRNLIEDCQSTERRQTADRCDEKHCRDRRLGGADSSLDEEFDKSLAR
jgi:hypothetical protein